MSGPGQFVRIADSSQVGEARRAGIAMAAAQGFNAVDQGRVAVVITEAATNIIKHAGGGEIVLRPIDSGLEMLAIDKGPGIANLARAMEDSHSTAGTQGIGLGAIARMASAADIYTASGLGTAILARFKNNSQPPLAQDPPAALEIGVVQSCYPGEALCGDAWGAVGHDVFMADGLGHGEHASAAAEAAVGAFTRNARLPASEVIEEVHLALRNTRGAAVALVRVDFDSGKARFCGLGNISGVVVRDGESRSMVSHNGTAGHQFHRIAEFEYALSEMSLVILHTDGLSAKWDMKSYPGLESRDPSLIAAVLYRDFRRQRDDATILVVKRRDRLQPGVRG